MSSAADNLRDKAEAMLSKSGTEVAGMSAEAVQKLLYEFQVYQIELELQNEELKHSQHELMLSRDRYARLYDSSPIGYLTLNEKGVIQMANPAAMRQLGAGNNDLLNNNLCLFINSSDRDKYYFFIRSILTQRTDQTVDVRLNGFDEIRSSLNCQGFMYCGCTPEICTHGASFIYVEFHGHYNQDESGEISLCLSMLDITETVKTHDAVACLNEKLEKKVFQQTMALIEVNHDLIENIEQLKFYRRQIIEREAKFNAIFDAAVEGIITIYLSGAIVSVNNSAESIFGYSREEMINLNIDKLIPLTRHKNHVPHPNNASQIELSSIVGKIKQMTGIRKDNSIVPLDISIARFSLDGTNYLTCIVRDVSARKLQEQLDQERLDELAHVTRLGLMGEMASSIAHEVNQPLTAIASYSQVCMNLMQRDNYDQDMLKEVLSKINQQSLRAGQIIHRMRDFVKSNKIYRSTADINSLIYEAVGLCESYLKQNSIVVQLKLKENLPVIYIDCIQIEQVVLNLIRNGIDALMNLPRSVPRNLNIQTVMNKDGKIEVRIKDNGPGIEDAEKIKILTPFYTTKSEGMGMGLSICRSIVEAHEGELFFTSQPGKGATFCFTLPVRRNVDGL